jgi:hypothetical protein
VEWSWQRETEVWGHWWNDPDSGKPKYAYSSKKRNTCDNSTFPTINLTNRRK